MRVVVMAWMSIGRSATINRMMIGSASMMPISILTAASRMSGRLFTRRFVAVVTSPGRVWMSSWVMVGSASMMPMKS